MLSVLEFFKNGLGFFVVVNIIYLAAPELSCISRAAPFLAPLPVLPVSSRRVINRAVHGKSTVISESYSSVARDIPGDILGKGGLPASSWTTRFNLSDFQEHRRSMTPPSEDPFTTGKGSGFLGGEE